MAKEKTWSVFNGGELDVVMLLIQQAQKADSDACWLRIIVALLSKWTNSLVFYMVMFFLTDIWTGSQALYVSCCLLDWQYSEKRQSARDLRINCDLTFSREPVNERRVAHKKRTTSSSSGCDLLLHWATNLCLVFRANFLINVFLVQKVAALTQHPFMC